jgi:hypothetical protein
MANSLIGDLLGGGVGAAGYADLMNRFDKTQSDTNAALDKTSAQGTALAQGTFKPYGVTSGYGNVTMNPDGSVNSKLTGLGQQQQNLGGFYGLQAWKNAAMDPTQRQNQLYGAMSASMAPEQERARKQMEAQLARSGRLGMMSKTFGGTPEQLAFEKATQEQQLKNWLGAQGAAQSEQRQQFDMGQGWLESSQLPTKNLLESAQVGMANKGMNNAMTTHLMNYLAEMGLGRATSNANFDNIKANLAGDMYGAGSQLAGSAGDAISGSDWFKRLFS